jgi:hypothetical protein
MCCSTLGDPGLAWLLQDGITDASSTEQVTRQIKVIFKQVKEPTKCLQNYEIRVGAAYSFALSTDQIRDRFPPLTGSRLHHIAKTS